MGGARELFSLYPIWYDKKEREEKRYL